MQKCNKETKQCFANTGAKVIKASSVLPIDKNFTFQHNYVAEFTNENSLEKEMKNTAVQRQSHLQLFPNEKPLPTKQILAVKKTNEQTHFPTSKSRHLTV